MADPRRPPPRCYRLRGLVSQRERRFLLQLGINRIGSLTSGEVVLPVQGVSRHHAEIEVAGDRIELRDLGSKNGTFLNDRRTGRAPLQAGDLVSLGGVQLRFEEIGAGDSELALQFRPTGPLYGEAPAGETSVLKGESQELLAVVLRLLELLTAGAAADVALALRTVVTACAAAGALVGEWDEPREPRAISVCGDVAAWSAFEPELQGLLGSWRAGAPAPTCQLASRLLDQLYVCGCLRRPGQTLLYLVVWGGGDERGCAGPLIELFLRLFARLTSDRGEAPAAASALPDLVTPAGYVRGESRPMQAIYSALRDLAGSDLPVLFEGETGVGKECLVRMLHGSSPRAHLPFVAINCAAIPAELLEAELFGIRKGVATGVDERMGRFRQAASGTLLLDEIADLPAALQSKLLRVLQERTIEPLGGGSYPLEARIVAATNGSLEEQVARGRFRADLYYRIAGYVLQVPALRQRRDDIPLLVESLVQRNAAEAGKWVRGITVKALETLVAHAWPGNVRELENEVRRLVQRCPHGEIIDSSLLSESLRRAAVGEGALSRAPEDPLAIDPDGLDLPRATKALEHRLIAGALERTGGNRSQAARLLGISRNTLAEKIERLGIARHATDPAS